MAPELLRGASRDSRILLLIFAWRASFAAWRVSVTNGTGIPLDAMAIASMMPASTEAVPLVLTAPGGRTLITFTTSLRVRSCSAPAFVNIRSSFPALSSSVKTLLSLRLTGSHFPEHHAIHSRRSFLRYLGSLRLESRATLGDHYHPATTEDCASARRSPWAPI